MYSKWTSLHPHSPKRNSQASPLLVVGNFLFPVAFCLYTTLCIRRSNLLAFSLYSTPRINPISCTFKIFTEFAHILSFYLLSRWSKILSPLIGILATNSYLVPLLLLLLHSISSTRPPQSRELLCSELCSNSSLVSKS